MMDKAKAYDEALENARKLLDKILNNELLGFPDQIREIFPQLKESNDERIRKSLIEFLTDIKRISESGRSVWAVREDDAEMCESFIAYLEKQKECVVDNTSEDEQKPTDDKAFEEWIDSWFKEHKEKAYPQITMDEKEFKNFCRGIRNMYQQKSDWSEEDERMLSRCIKSVECSKQFADSETYKAAKDVEINWLKDIFLDYKKFTEAVYKLWSNDWSEKDEEMRNALWNLLKIQYAQDYSMTCVGIKAGKFRDWLKSLCPSWKPSEEQMNRLFSIIAALRKDYCDDMADFLANLYADLKKLGVKEEPEYYQHFDPDC